MIAPVRPAESFTSGNNNNIDAWRVSTKTLHAILSKDKAFERRLAGIGMFNVCIFNVSRIIL
jgi:hypothetical protein